MTILVVDAGTSGVRSVALEADGTVAAEVLVEVLPGSPAAGLVEIDATATARAALATATSVLDRVGSVDAVGITNQRASTIAWDARSGDPVGPGIGWQDLRTVGRCLALQPEGIRIAPNASATKAEWLVQHSDIPAEHLRIGTVDTWLAWVLSGGSAHITDASNALVTGLYDAATGDWSEELLDLLGIPRSALATVTDSSGALAEATALPGAPPITALVGDQQASLLGQGCIHPGDTKLTLGTGGMLDICLGPEAGPTPRHGTFPMIGWRLDGVDTWAREAVMLSAGTCVEWLRDGLGIIDEVAESEVLASSVPDAGDVVFVPALSGLGTPIWDHGARGLLVGITRGTTRAHLARAVLEGVALRAADLVDAAEADTGLRADVLRVDGGMSANHVVLQALADATRQPVERSGHREATAIGAGFLAGIAAGTWSDLAAATETRAPAARIEPDGELDRERFADACRRGAGWIPELTSLEL
ncbi:FGGY-family carbohydrate kinase [Acidimicrobiia bacterium EGI L10123]|uniref:FGGY family carbohydrate kinase n=1 Tax=Salinilacustrithrix flava TaxID=2957203 RepID=UPI003D7C2343|nr:FGGY-family carbohydrate kinase [Acidimicrobiia bacterium EGI L10123]